MSETKVMIGSNYKVEEDVDETLKKGVYQAHFLGQLVLNKIGSGNFFESYDINTFIRLINEGKVKLIEREEE